MSTGYQIKEQNALYYMTLQVVYWVDIFTRKTYRDLVIESLLYCQKEKGLEVYAYVIMSNHTPLARMFLLARARLQRVLFFTVVCNDNCAAREIG
jgi:hypothetical protein